MEVHRYRSNNVLPVLSAQEIGQRGQESSGTPKQVGKRAFQNPFRSRRLEPFPQFLRSIHSIVYGRPKRASLGKGASQREYRATVASGVDWSWTIEVCWISKCYLTSSAFTRSWDDEGSISELLWHIFSLADAEFSSGQQLTPRFDREGRRPTGDAGPSEPDGELILAFS